ncbi:hypothetical protein EHQ94_00055 [Leptospira meyeri]|nr:hypothetical protein EHQ93_11525 [Leptospira meyeri]TGM74350.1 hypothetical protein EHQ94_00055 [Leptospira meyeri]
MKKIEEILNKTQTEYSRFWAEVAEARNQWNELSKRVESITEKFQGFYKNGKSPYPFIMHDSSLIVNIKFTDKGIEKSEKRTANFNAINVSLGNSPIGISYESSEYNVTSGKKKNEKWEAEVEHNASLTLSQLPNGSIAVIYFPTSSKLSKHLLGLYDDEYKEGEKVSYIKKIYEFPNKITDREIINLFEFLIEFSMYTSPVYRCGKLKHFYYSFLFWKYRKRYLKLASSLGGFFFLLGRLVTIKT